MKIYDISMELTPEMTVWKDRDAKKPQFTITRDFDENGQGGRETKVTLDMHTGTHIDAPLHFVAGGKTIAHTTLEQLVRPVKVLDLTDVVDRITAMDLQKFDLNSGDFLICKTENSYHEGKFDPDFIYLDRTGAEYLLSRDIAGVGIDALGIERSQPDHSTHLQLLKNEIIIIEGLRLADVEQGEYFMVAAPLKFVDVEAAPARIFLLDSLDAVN